MQKCNKIQNAWDIMIMTKLSSNFRFRNFTIDQFSSYCNGKYDFINIILTNVLRSICFLIKFCHTHINICTAYLEKLS